MKGYIKVFEHVMFHVFVREKNLGGINLTVDT